MKKVTDIANNSKDKISPIAFKEEGNFNPLEFLTQDEVNEVSASTSNYASSTKNEDNYATVSLVNDESTNDIYTRGNVTFKQKPYNKLISPLELTDVTDVYKNSNVQSELKTNATFDSCIINAHSTLPTNSCSQKVSFYENSTNLYYHPLFFQLLNKKGEQITNFHIAIAQMEITNLDDNGGKIEKYYLLCYLSDNKETVEKIVVTNRELLSSTWISKKLGAAYLCFKEYCQFRNAFSELIKQAPKNELLSSIGWYNLGQGFNYFYGNGSVLKELYPTTYGNRNYTLDFSLDQYPEKFWLNEAIGMLKITNTDFEIGLILLLYSLLSLLKTPFKLAGLNINFCLALIGDTGSCKTELSKMFGCQFNRNEYDVDAKIYDTPKSIENRMTVKKDSIMILDDLHPENRLERQKLSMENLEFVLRIIGDNKGKSRSAGKSCSNIELKADGLCIVTAEYGAINPSSIARYLGLYFNKNTVNMDVLSYYQKNKCNFPTFIYYFLRWFAQNFNSNVAYIQQLVVEMRYSLKMGHAHKRMIDMFIALSIMWKLFREYCKLVLNKDTNATDEIEIQNSIRTLNYMNSIDADFYINEAINAHIKQNIIIKPELQFLSAISEMIESNSLKIYNKAHGKAGDSIFHGYFDDDYLYLLPDEAYSLVIKHYKKQNIDFLTSKLKIFEMLDTIGIIETKVESGKRRRTIGVKITGATLHRYLVIRKKEMTETLSQIN